MPRNLLPKESDTGRPEPHFRTSETCLETKHEITSPCREPQFQPIRVRFYPSNGSWSGSKC